MLNFSSLFGVRTNKQTKEAPALASLNGVVYMLRKDTDTDDIWSCHFTIDPTQTNAYHGHWSKSVRTGNHTSKAPALVEHNGKLYGAWKGNKSTNIYFGELSTITGKFENVEKVHDSKSNDSPTLSVHYGKIFLWHTGKKWVSLYRNKYEDGKWSGDKKISIGDGAPDPLSVDAPSATTTDDDNIILVHGGETNKADVYRFFYKKSPGHYVDDACIRKDHNLESTVPTTIIRVPSREATYLIGVASDSKYSKNFNTEENQIFVLKEDDGGKGNDFKYHQSVKVNYKVPFMTDQYLYVKAETKKRVAATILSRTDEDDILFIAFKDRDTDYVYFGHVYAD